MLNLADVGVGERGQFGRCKGVSIRVSLRAKTISPFAPVQNARVLRR